MAPGDLSTNLVRSLSLSTEPRSLSLGEQARAFSLAMGFPLGEPGDTGAYNFQVSLVKEEFKEWLWADSNEAELKELCDVIFTLYQVGALMGWDVDTAMRRIFESNMTKVDNDGKPVKNAAGKVQKGENYIPPDLSDLV